MQLTDRFAIVVSIAQLSATLQAAEPPTAASPEASVSEATRSFHSTPTVIELEDLSGATVCFPPDPEAISEAAEPDSPLDHPGSLDLTIEPADLAGGDPYRLTIEFHNESSEALEVRRLFATSIIDGRRLTGLLPPLVSRIEAGERVTVFSMEAEKWPEAKEFALEATLLAGQDGRAQGVSYKSRLEWR